MAIFAVKIDNLATLRMNEFFDYAGECWALSRHREDDGMMGAELEDFYDGTVRSGHMEGVPVIFVYEDQIIGWYEKAMIYRYVRRPALFLEGNICAKVQDVRLLLKSKTFPGLNFGKDKNYLVIEADDARFEKLHYLMQHEKGPFETIEYTKVPVDPRAKNAAQHKSGIVKRVTSQDKVESLLGLCELFASEIMEDRCPGIGTVKALEEAALQATRYSASNVNAWYYLAMANYQLGFVKKGLRAIDRAVRLEPDADDLLVMEGNLMVSNGCLAEALNCYESAYEICPDDSYYVMAGQACKCMGNRIAERQYYKKVKDTDRLKEFGILPGKKSC
ncbi:MAG: hypothetical protein II251_03135 [Lachnospiraceae bacterium]|nr:hypothetical protein [Lachnospiraceae bacterium]